VFLRVDRYQLLIRKQADNRTRSVLQSVRDVRCCLLGVFAFSNVRCRRTVTGVLVDSCDGCWRDVCAMKEINVNSACHKFAV
jgi:hypothetical protein